MTVSKHPAVPLAMRPVYFVFLSVGVYMLRLGVAVEKPTSNYVLLFLVVISLVASDWSDR